MKLSDVTRNLGLTAAHSDGKNAAKPEFEKPLGPKEVYLSWTAISRPEMGEMNAKMARTFTVIGWFFGILLLLMREFFLILVLVSFVVISKALRQTPPEEEKYEISNHGVKFGEQLFPWSDFSSYFLKPDSGLHILVAVTKAAIPGRVYISYKKKDEDKLVKLFGEHLEYLEEEPKTSLDTFFDKVMDKLDFGA